MDEHLESSWRLVYYQVSGEPGIAGCSRRSDIHLGECGVARASLFTDHHCVILFSRDSRGWSRPRNYFNSEIFPIYGTYKCIFYCCSYQQATIGADPEIEEGGIQKEWGLVWDA